MKAQMENLKNARPDLIIGDFFHLKFYDQLKLIAPTVILNYQADWREFHMRIAELVGRERDAENTFRLLENKTVKAKEDCGNAAGRRMSLFCIWSSIIYVFRVPLIIRSASLPIPN